MLIKLVKYFDEVVGVACDENCHKAFGIGGRPKNQLSNDVDDYEWLSDGEVADAPTDPGSYEGGYAKPRGVSERMNRWCVRECERSVMVGLGEVCRLKDFSKRIQNKPKESTP